MKFSGAAVGVLVAVAVLTACDAEPPKTAKPPTPATAPTPPPVVRRTPPPQSTVPPPGTEGWGEVVARKGDVAAYAAIRDGQKLRVPVVIVSTGGPGFYDVTIRVKGPNGYEATGSFSTDTVRLQAGASWPTEVTVSMPGRAAPELPEVEISEVKQR